MEFTCLGGASVVKFFGRREMAWTAGPTTLVAGEKVFLMNGEFLSLDTGVQLGTMTHPQGHQIVLEALSEQTPAHEEGLLYAKKFLGNGTAGLSAFDPITTSLVIDYPA